MYDLKKSVVACLTILSSFGLVKEAFSEVADSESRRVIEEIVITAERRESFVQSTPVAVTALSAEDREQLGLRNIQQIAQFTPGVSYQSSPNRFTIRGIGRQTNALGSDPGVATYYDGTYTSETAAIGQIPLFVERTEILRGPQGTLFGRNAVGGLVNVISRRPEDEFSADFQASTNDYGLAFFATSITGPVAGFDNVSYRLNAWSNNQSEGFQENLGPGPDAGSSESSFMELQIEADLSDRLYAWLRHNMTTWDTVPYTTSMRAPYSSTVFQGALAPFSQYGLTDNPSVSDNRKVRANYAGLNDLNNTYQTTLNLIYAFDNMDIKYIGSYAQYDWIYTADGDGTDQLGFDYPLIDPASGFQYGSIPVSTDYVLDIEEVKRYISHELQVLTSNENRIQFVGGIYYYEEEITQPYDVRLPNEPALQFPLSLITFTPVTPNPGGTVYRQLGNVQSEQFAIYGQVDIAASDKLNITAGLRYSKDDKLGYEEQRLVSYNPSLAPGMSFDVSLNLNGPVTRGGLEKDWSAVSGKLGFDYELNSDSMVYGSISKGYKSGGMNLGGLEGYDPTQPGGVSPTNTPFVEEESVWAYEAGWKNSILDNRLRLNLAAFYYDYEDMQAPINYRDSNDITLTDFVNIPEATSLGFEVEALWLVSENLQLIANYSYLDTELSEFLLLVDTALLVPEEVNVEGNALPKSPENKVTIAASYFLDTDLGTFTLSANWNHISEQYTGFFERELYNIGSFSTAGARIIFDNLDESLRMILSVSNITDEDAPINSLGFAGIFNNFARTETPGLPRIVSFELTKKFGM